MYLVNATGIHQGGGLRVLKNLINSIDTEALILVDHRLNMNSMPQLPNVRYKQVSARWISRLWFEIKPLKKRYSKLISLNSIPNLFRRTDILYFHNYAILFSPWSNIRKILLFFLSFRVTTIVVQTQHTKEAISKFCGHKEIFVEQPYVGRQITLKNTKVFDFFYPCTFEKHKNVEKVLDAWKLLAERNLFPRLALTIPAEHFAEFYTDLQRYSRLSITNLGWIDEKDVASTMAISDYLLFASDYETLGLPLCDAHASGLKSITSAQDYVFEVCQPVRTFNQKSALSIANAVATEMGHPGAFLRLKKDSGSLIDLILKEE